MWLQGRARSGPTFGETMLLHAVARLALHPEITNIQASWVKLGPEGVMAKTRDERVVSAPVPVETVNGLGAGDSFGGAFCHGINQGWPLEQVLDYANAAGAIVASQLACADAMPTLDELTELVATQGGPA